MASPKVVARARVGGEARARVLSADRRREIAIQGAQARWGSKPKDSAPEPPKAKLPQEAPSPKPPSKDPWDNAIANLRQFLSTEDIEAAVQAGAPRLDIWRTVLQAIDNRTAEDAALCAHIALKARKGPSSGVSRSKREDDYVKLSALAYRYFWVQSKLALGAWSRVEALQVEASAVEAFGAALFIDPEHRPLFLAFMKSGVPFTYDPGYSATEEKSASKKRWETFREDFEQALSRWEKAARKAVRNAPT